MKIYWEHLTAAAGTPHYHWFVLGFLFAVVLLLTWVPSAKRRLSSSLLLFLLSVVGLLIAAAIPEASVLHSWFRIPALVLQIVATVNVISVFLFRFLLRAIGLEPPPILRDLMLGAAYVIAAMGVFSTLPSSLAGLVTASAIVSAVIGFSLQDTLGNIMAGMGLQMERSITVGDWIRIEGKEGIVRETRWRQTSIETRDGDTILIPNAQIMKSSVTILGRRSGQPAQHRQWVLFTIDYRHAPQDVINAVAEALPGAMPHVMDIPAPYCVMTDLKEGAGAYGVCYWIDDLAWADTAASGIRSRLYAALKRAGIALPTPAENDPARQKREQDEADLRFKLLRNMNIFHPLTDDEVRQLATQLRVAPFVRGEAITRQGASAHWLYIMAKGSAEVRLGSDGAADQKVATLGPGDFFGEMGLLTGAPRSATVITEVDSLCYRLDKDAFTQVLSRRPELAEGISHILADRRAQLDAAQEDLNESARKTRGHNSEQDLLRRIRNFFFLQH
jgi:small-conductance mechanosensitive channel/CRP-like cAMP-binding protein